MPMRQSVSTRSRNALLRIDGALMSEAKPRLVGLNHIALEVGDVDEALSFYGQIFSCELRGRSIDMDVQFIALMETRSPHSDQHRHFGLVVDDRSRVRTLLRPPVAALLEG